MGWKNFKKQEHTVLIQVEIRTLSSFFSLIEIFNPPPEDMY